MISYIKVKLPDILIFIILIIIGIKISYGSERFTDIWYYDESMYLTKGINFEPFVRAYRDGYFYFLWYKILSFFTADNIELYFLNNTILLFLPGLALYLLLRTLKVNILLSFFGSVVLLLSSVNIYAWPFVTKYVLLIMLTGFIILYKIKNSEHKLIFSIFFSAVLMYTRPEYILTFSILCIVYIIYVIRNLRNESLFGIIMKAIFLLSLFVLIYRFNPVTGYRANLAFTQHYVKDINDRNGSELSGLNNSDAILNEHFGENVSMLSALKNNPKLFFEHVWYNFIRLKDSIKQIIPYSIIEEKINILIIILQILVITTILFSIYSIIKRVSTKEYGLFCLIYFIFVLPTVISILVYYPRDHYLIIVITLVLVYFCYELSNVLSSYRTVKINSAVVAITVGAVLIFLVPFRADTISIHESHCTNLKTLKFLINLKLTDNVNFFNVGSGMQTYMGNNWHYKSAQLIDSTFENFVIKNQVNLIIVNPLTLFHRKIEGDSDFKKIQADTNFVKIDIPDCSSYVLVKKILYNDY